MVGECAERGKGEAEWIDRLVGNSRRPLLPEQDRSMEPRREAGQGSHTRGAAPPPTASARTGTCTRLSRTDVDDNESID